MSSRRSQIAARCSADSTSNEHAARHPARLADHAVPALRVAARCPAGARAGTARRPVRRPRVPLRTVRRRLLERNTAGRANRDRRDAGRQRAARGPRWGRRRTGGGRQPRRPGKAWKFCSANSDDAVTWTVVRALEQTGQLDRVAAAVGLADAIEASAPPRLLLWGAAARPSDPDAAAAEALLTELSIDLREALERRSEPDVIVLWDDAVVVIE